MSLYDRESLARLPLSSAQRRNHLPADPSIVCWDPPMWGDDWVREHYFTAYTRTVEVPRLAGKWNCFAR